MSLGNHWQCCSSRLFCQEDVGWQRQKRPFSCNSKQQVFLDVDQVACKCRYTLFFFKQKTAYEIDCDWSSTCALPIYQKSAIAAFLRRPHWRESQRERAPENNFLLHLTPGRDKA